MFKKIAQWIRIRQERRLRKKIMMRALPSVPLLVRENIEATEMALRYIIDGEIPQMPAQEEIGQRAG